MEKIQIEVTSLKEDERLEVARLLIKSGYAVRLGKEKSGNKTRHYIIAER